MPIVKISDALTSLVQRYGLEHRLAEGDVMVRWPEIVGETIAHVAEPLRCERGELVVRVRSAVWRNELQMCSRDVMEKIEKIFPGVVKKIIWR